MPDLGAILRKAREDAVLHGAAGASGATAEKLSVSNTRPGRGDGPTAEIDVGPLGPPAVLGPTGPKPSQVVGPAYSHEYDDKSQRLSGAGPSGPTGPSEKRRVCENDDLTRSRRLERGPGELSGSDWWAGPGMAEMDALGPSTGAPVPISPAEVRAGVARELRLLADLGVTGSEAERRAVAITRGKVGNSPALAVRQTNTGRCAVCDGPLREAEVAIAVLNPGGSPLHLHAACHDSYRARRRALVARIMESAGYGPARTNGEAA